MSEFDCQYFRVPHLFFTGIQYERSGASLRIIPTITSFQASCFCKYPLHVIIKSVEHKQRKKFY